MRRRKKTTSLAGHASRTRKIFNEKMKKNADAGAILLYPTAYISADETHRSVCSVYLASLSLFHIVSHSFIVTRSLIIKISIEKCCIHEGSSHAFKNEFK